MFGSVLVVLRTSRNSQDETLPLKEANRYLETQIIDAGSVENSTVVVGYEYEQKIK